MAENRTSCEQCKLFIELKEPFCYEKTGYPQGVTVYGFCTKDIHRLNNLYPVYIPDGGVCGDFVRDPKKPDPPPNVQLVIEYEV